MTNAGHVGCGAAGLGRPQLPDVMCIMLTRQANIEAVVRAVNEGSVYHIFT